MPFFPYRRRLLSGIFASAALRALPLAGRRALLASPAMAMTPLARANGQPGQPAVPTDDRQTLRAPALTYLPALPAELRLDFNVFYGDFLGQGLQVAQASYHLSHQDQRYRLETEARATGIVAIFYSGTLLQTSVGVLGAGGFVPQHYTEKRGRRPERRLNFDARIRRIRLAGDPPVDMPYPEGTQDRLSIFFQLGLLARDEQQSFRPGQRFTLPLAGTRRIDEPLFEVLSRAPLRTQAGVFDALHISVRKPGDQDAPRFDIWLAPALQMLPVRIRVLDGSDGKVVDQVLKKRPASI